MAFVNAVPERLPKVFFYEDIEDSVSEDYDGSDDDYEESESEQDEYEMQYSCVRKMIKSGEAKVGDIFSPRDGYRGEGILIVTGPGEEDFESPQTTGNGEAWLLPGYIEYFTRAGFHYLDVIKAVASVDVGSGANFGGVILPQDEQGSELKTDKLGYITSCRGMSIPDAGHEVITLNSLQSELYDLGKASRIFSSGSFP